MSSNDTINEFKSYAGQLIKKYSLALLPNHIQKMTKLSKLDKAIYKMENELNGKQADLLYTASSNPQINEKALDENLSEITRSSIKELLRQNV